MQYRALAFGEAQRILLTRNMQRNVRIFTAPTLAPALTSSVTVCRDIWNRSSFSTIAWLLVAALLALFYASIAYSFYRQLLDPTFARAPSDQVRLAALQGRGAPYGGGHVPYPGFNNNVPTYAPPAGAPPGFGTSAPPYEGGRLPGYGSDFAPRDGYEKEKDGDPFSDSQQHLGAGPSEMELGRPGYRV